jgi:ATP-dependent Clp protease ATP-binding subunit ClpA
MEKSKALELVWKIALIEALGSRNEEIFPEHFMCGLLKFVELSRDKISTLLSGDEETLPGVTSEQKKLAEMVADLNIDTTRARRTLRKKVPRGDLEKVRKVIRRSAESRQRFLEAEEMAEKKNNARLRTYDLLQALLKQPTAAMQSVLNVSEESVNTLPTPEDTPTLNQFGRNILKAIPEPEQSPDGLQPQVRAVLGHLVSPRPDPLILIADAPTLAGAVVRQTAR